MNKRSTIRAAIKATTTWLILFGLIVQPVSVSAVDCPCDSVNQSADAPASCGSDVAEQSCCCSDAGECHCAGSEDHPPVQPTIPPSNDSNESQAHVYANVAPSDAVPTIADNLRVVRDTDSFSISARTAQQSCVLLSRFTC